MTEEDKTQLEAVAYHLSDLGLEGPPREWLLVLWASIQALDDWMDGNARKDVEQAARWLLVELPSNAFFQANSAALLPLLGSAILKWAAANRAEADKKPCALSFAWRAAFWEIVLQVVALAHGPVAAMEAGPKVMAMYGDSFEEYLKEFGG